MPIKFLLLGGGFWVFLEGGGGSATFIFMGVGIFPNFRMEEGPSKEPPKHLKDTRQAF